VLRLSKALQLLRPQIDQCEQGSDETACAIRDHEGGRLGKTLEPCREVRRLAHDRLLLGGAPPDEVADYGRPGREADADLKRLSRAQLLERFDQGEPGAHRLLGVVLMGLRISEIDEDAVAHVLGHEPAITPDHLGHAALIGPDHLPEVLGVHTRRKLCRPDDITEHYRQLTALSLRAARPVRLHSRNRWQDGIGY
jgi:hypothetical protein